ncbi:MAG TPA: metalloregulator ArsR/SmtB family transcription factor [Terracidiphilus sp.]|nr:metalloregulator ArsR/SmtB family transcription factor [Terracidiphilus sp.]
MHMSSGNPMRKLAESELDRVASQFRLLGETMRLRILQAICDKKRTVGEIVEATGATQPNVSRHLALLAASGLIQREKEGHFVYYGLSDPLIVKLCQLVHAQLRERE